jgi:hypothetical protein
MPKQQDKTTPDPFEFAQAWRPDQDDGPVLEGVFTDINEGFSDYGSYPIVVITTDNDDEYAWHAMTEVAKQQLTKAEPKIKHRLRITYGGKKESKTPGREPYTRWRVENLSISLEDRATSLLNKYAGDPSPMPKKSEFADEPPF